MDPLHAALRSDLALFTEKVFKTVDPGSTFLHNWHIDLIAEYLTACQNGEIKRLIINIPPRHLKSISVAVAFPAWLLGHNPSERIMAASYSKELSLEHSTFTRVVLESEWYKRLFPETIIADDENTKHKFLTTKMGYRMATSVGGTGTGKGGNFLIVDDPISAKQGDSDVTRETANIWFDRTFSTRLNDKKKGCIIVVMQRLHENDLTGHLLHKGGWEHLKIPIIAEEDEIIQKGVIRIERKAGGILHASRMGVAEIDREKVTLGPYGFAGQYQQRPSPEGGGKFKKAWMQYYDKISIPNLNSYMYVDPAGTKGNKSDYTSLWMMGAGGDKNYYWYDGVRDRLNLKERIDLVFDMHMKYKPKEVFYQCYGMEGDIQAIEMEQERVNYRFKITPVRNMAPKGARIERLVPPLSDSRMYFPKTLYKTDYEGRVRELIDEFIHQELEAYPNGLHDDMLDSMSMMFDHKPQFPGIGGVNYRELYAGR